MPTTADERVADASFGVSRTAPGLRGLGRDDDSISVHLKGGRTISAPLA